MDFLSGGLAAMGAVIVSNPFDVVKTRLQLQGEMAARGQHAVHYRGSLHAMYVIARIEGLGSLQKGLLVAAGFQMIMNGTRLGLYQTAHSRGWTRGKDGEVYFPKTLIWGSIAGITGTVVASPFYLVKTQIQSHGAEKIAVGYQHRHTGVLDAFRSIYRSNGVRGLWAGVGSSIPRAAVGSSTQLSTFTMSKDYLKRNNICANSPVASAFLASCLSGIVITTCMCPFDVVATRLYNQKRDSGQTNLLYKGVLDCLVKTYKAEGFFGYYKGFGALYLRLAPHTTVSLVLWDWLNTMHRRLSQMWNDIPSS